MVCHSPTISPELYNAVLTRLEAEERLRAQLQNDLRAAREHADMLQRQLSELTTSPTTTPTQTPSTAPTEPYTTAPATPAARAPARASPPSQQHSSSPSQDKEILSHCSDISNCKGTANGSRTPDTQSLSRGSTRKSPAAIAKKSSKGKKERPSKVKIPGQSRYWTPCEHKLFLEALQKFGHKDLRAISNFVGTRNMTQVRTHSQKYFMRLMREAKRQNPAGKSDGDKKEEDLQQEGSSNVQPVVAAPASPVAAPQEPKESDDGDKYSVPNTCGMTLLCLVGQDTLPV